MSRISWIAPKSSARRQMNGWISSRKSWPSAHVARRGAGADEGRPLPRQRGAFIIADRGIDRQRDRGHFRRRPQAQVDPGDIAVMGPLLHQLDEPPAIADRRFARLVARPARQVSGIEQQDQVDVGRIVELAAAELAQREDGKALGSSSGTRSSIAALSASSIAASAKSESVAVTHSRVCSPLRSASATASASA